MLTVDPEWKAKMLEQLRALGVMEPGFTGQLVIDCNQGGITALTRTEKIR
jgi:hypothetical protein